MQEIFDKIKEKLKEHPFVFMTHGCEYGDIPLDKALEVVDQVAAEYTDDLTYKLALMYARSIHIFGVDIFSQWETATQQSYALEQAYMRGRQDERDKFLEWIEGERK